jgi:hypothetical protein
LTIPVAMLLARNKYVRHCVHQGMRHVAPK